MLEVAQGGEGRNRHTHTTHTGSLVPDPWCALDWTNKHMGPPEPLPFLCQCPISNPESKYACVKLWHSQNAMDQPLMGQARMPRPPNPGSLKG